MVELKSFCLPELFFYNMFNHLSAVVEGLLELLLKSWYVLLWKNMKVFAVKTPWWRDRKKGYTEIREHFVSFHNQLMPTLLKLCLKYLDFLIL